MSVDEKGGIMPKYLVSYSENTIRNLVVDAGTQEEAEQKVIDGDADYDNSIEVDATIVGVNSSELIEEPIEEYIGSE
jgi:hypothetical protein